jgi:hypothetical protein
MRKFKFNIGDKINMLTLLERIIVKKNNHRLTYYRCLCDCGKEKNILSSNISKSKRQTKSCGCYIKNKLNELNKERSKKCHEKITKEKLNNEYIKNKNTIEKIAQIFQCSEYTIKKYLREYNIPIRNYKDRRKINKIKNNGLWKGYEEITGSYFKTIKNRAKLKNQEFSITIKEIWELYLKQDKKCALSGIPIYFQKIAGDKYRQEQTASLDRIDSSKGYIQGNIQWVHKDINKMKNTLDEHIFIKLCNEVSNYNKIKEDNK